MEIPEGSNSAKARRSDIVANDDIDIHRKSTQFHEPNVEAISGDGVHTGSDTQDHLAYSASLEEAAKRHQEEIAQAAKEQLVNDSQAAAHDNLQSVESSVNPDNLAHLPATDADARNLQELPDEALRDRFAQVAGGALKDTRAPALNQNNPLADRFGHEANSGLQDRTKGMKQEAIKDRLVGMAGAEPAANNIGLPFDNSAQGSNAGLASEALKDNLQGLEDEALKDNLQGLQDEALKDNHQGLEDEALKDNHQGLEDEALKDNRQPLETSALGARKDSQDKEHVQDHIVNLPPTQRSLAPGPRPAVSQTASPADARTTTTVTRQGNKDHGGAVAPASPAAHPSHAALSKAEQAKRMEEFHGRVEAIRKSVSGINHLLDDLQDKH